MGSQVIAELWTGYVLFQNDSVQSLLARVIGIIGAFPRHMMASGIAPTVVTLSTLMQVCGRANEIARGLEVLVELLGRGVPAETLMWRPLLHTAARAGDVAATQRLYEHMREATAGCEVFDSQRQRVSHQKQLLLPFSRCCFPSPQLTRPNLSKWAPRGRGPPSPPQAEAVRGREKNL